VEGPPQCRGGVADLHGFYGSGELVFYVASTSDEAGTERFDLTEMVARGGRPAARVLGLESAGPYTGRGLRPALMPIPAQEAVSDGRIVAALAPGEILELRLGAFEPTATFAEDMARMDSSFRARPGAQSRGPAPARCAPDEVGTDADRSGRRLSKDAPQSSDDDGPSRTSLLLALLPALFLVGLAW
jgi:hypothetical protein